MEALIQMFRVQDHPFIALAMILEKYYRKSVFFGIYRNGLESYKKECEISLVKGLLSATIENMK